jgi:serine/threonine protein kinase
MTPERWQQVADTLDQILRCPAQQRSAYLSQIASSDPDLQVEVESLLASYEKADTAFLSGSAVGSLAGERDTMRENMVGRRLGAYQLSELIGVGGMGEVYRAARADDQYSKQVAVKLVRAGQDIGFVGARFKNERQILAKLDHPNIARLIDGGSTPEGVPYFVMELIEGEPVDEYTAKHELPIKDRLQLFLHVCSAVQFAHQRLVVHRDLKPSNILVTNEGVPKLLDFGIAKLLDPAESPDALQATATLFRMLTPGYASPEQIRGEPITTTSDVYSLGVVLYELLTGQSPYRITSQSAHEIAHAVCEIEPLRPSTAIKKTRQTGPEKSRAQAPKTWGALSQEKVSKYLSGDLDNIVLMALRKEPQRRYMSVEQFAEDIRRHLRDLPVAARQDTIRYRVSKFVARHRTGVAGTMAVLLALLGALTITIREAHIARQERARAERRFNDVRKLANSLIFEIHDSVRNVPGTTTTRKLIVERALEYLDSLAKESSADISLQRELAAAYVRIGKVQGGTNEANLGDTSASLGSYRKALEIRKSLFAAAPKDLENVEELSEAYRTVAEALGEMGSTQGALEYTQRARQLAEQAEPTHADDVHLLQELVRDYEAEANFLGGNFNRGTLGDAANAIAQRKKELGVSERVAKLRPNDTGIQRFLAVSVTQMGDQLLMNGQWRESADYYGRSEAVFERLVAQSPGSREDLEDLHAAYQRLQFIRVQEGDIGEAIQDCRLALEIANKLSHADPNDVWSRANLADDYGNLAGALSRTSDPRREAQPSAQKAIDLIHELVAHDPKNTEFQGVLSAAFTTAGDVHRRAGDSPGALGYYRQALAIAEKIVATDEKNVAGRMRLAANHNNVATTLVHLDDLAGATQEYEKAMTLLEAVRTSGSLSEQGLYAKADSYTGLGEVESRFADQQSTTSAGLAHRKKACGYYQASLKIWSNVGEPGVLSPDGFESVPPAAVSARASQCQVAIASVQAAATK